MYNSKGGLKKSNHSGWKLLGVRSRTTTDVLISIAVLVSDYSILSMDLPLVHPKCFFFKRLAVMTYIQM